MSANIANIIYGLVAADIILYFMLFVGYQRDRQMFNVPKIATPKEAFALFERAYKQLFPKDRDGFTWGEAIRKARRVTELNDFQWEAVQKSLRQYEAYRYAGIGEGGDIDTSAILRLTVLLRQKRYFNGVV